ncbi:MAG: transporter permease protein [Symbiobacteriaceae bacterium]|jgi:peptide/nickel transport system permease protein|nr:transporter permease protein [Symbiobacteriaceae bacterium]
MIRSKRWQLWLGLLIVAALLAAVLVPEWMTGVGPEYRQTAASAMDRVPPYPPGDGHWLGTDFLGRDMWSRLVYGTRWSLLIGLLVMGARLVIALPVAYAAAKRPRSVGWFVGRLYVLTGSIPPLIIYLLVLSNSYIRMLGLWPCLSITVGLLAFFEWPRLAIMLQGRIETLFAQPFMEGAVAVGATSRQIYRQHLRPHLWPIVLQAGAQEVARALLVVGQLGVFGIMTGGGVMEEIAPMRMEVISGVPEWGATLAEARKYTLLAPWMVLSPAMALFVAICGANWLALGLEGVALPLTRWQEATTGRLSARWRWVALPVAVAAVFWFFQGVPWGQTKELQALVEAQLAALQRGDVAAYMATIDPMDEDYQSSRQAWAEAVTEANFIQQVGWVQALDVDGAHGQTLMSLVPKGIVLERYRKGEPPRSRTVRYERRWGRWYEVDEDWAEVYGYHTILASKLPEYDPSVDGMLSRMQLAGLAGSADRAYDRLTGLTPSVDKKRQTVRLYADPVSFRAAMPAGGEGALAWYSPERREILISPEFLNTWDRQRFETVLSLELVKATGAKEAALSPLTMGLLVRKADLRPVYRPDYRQLVWATLLRYEELFAQPMDQLTYKEQEAFAIQATLLVEFLRERYPQVDVERLAREGAGPADLERETGASTVAMSAAWTDYLFARVADESILTVPMAKDRIPETAVAWARARGGVVLDMEGTDKLYVLERQNGQVRVVLVSWPM